MIQRCREFVRAVAADPSPARLQSRDAVGGRCALDPAKILDRDRHAVQRPLDLSGSDFPFGNGRFRKGGISHDVSVAFEPAIEPRDPVEHRPRHLYRRQLFRMYLLPNLDQPEVTKICRWHRHWPPCSWCPKRIHGLIAAHASPAWRHACIANLLCDKKKKATRP